MTDQHPLRDDIVFMRTLAEAGRNGPLMGGSILLAGGVIYAGCSLASWASLHYALNWDGFFPLVWGGGTAAFLTVLAWAKRRLPVGGGATAQVGAVWSATGWAALAIAVSLTVISARANAWWLMAVLPSVILALYGAAWSVAAMATRARWLRAVAVGAFAMAVVQAWFVIQPATVYLLFAIALIALLAAPGLVLMRQAKAA